MDVRNQVAVDLLRKYGILVDPDSLSDRVLARLAGRVNYPRVNPHATTLRAWCDRVLGQGEHVSLFLPQEPGRNTHLSTIQYLTESAGLLVSEIREMESVGAYEPEPELETEFEPSEGQDRAIHPNDQLIQKEIESITARANRGLNTLHALLEESEKWELVIKIQIQKILNKYQEAGEVDTLDAMTELITELNKTIAAARLVLKERSSGAPA